MHSNDSLDAFDYCMNWIRTRSQTRSIEKPMCLNEKLNSFSRSLKHVQTRPQTLSYSIQNAFKQDPGRLVPLESVTHSNTTVDLFALRVHAHVS